MSEHIKAVDNLNGMTPQELKAAIARRLAAKAEYDKVCKETEQAAQYAAVENAGKIEELRFRIFQIREQIKPLKDGELELYNELQAVSPEGQSKIKFSEDEQKKFRSRMNNESKAAAKAR